MVVAGLSAFLVHGFFTKLELLTSPFSRLTFRGSENQKIEIHILGEKRPSRRRREKDSLLSWPHGRNQGRGPTCSTSMTLF